MKTNYEKLMKINYEKLLIFYLPFTVERQDLLQLLGGTDAEFYQSSHGANRVLNSSIETVSPRSTAAISSSMSGVTCKMPSTILA